MKSPVEDEATVRAIRSLTIAVWALVLTLLIIAVTQVYLSFLPATLAQRIFNSSSGAAPPIPNSDEVGNFYELPVAEQISRASVIALTKFKKEDGNLTSIITAIPKQKSGTEFNYKVGGEYTHGNRYPRANTEYGDGEVIFFTGSPAMMRLSLSYSDGRINGMGELPLEKFNELIEKEK